MKVHTLLVALFLISCASNTKTEKTAKIYFQKAQQYKQAKNYVKALSNLSQIRREFFDSPYQQQALLMTSDIYFVQQNYASALASYTKHKRLYPQQQKAYVLYQMALCYKHQLPTRVEHDLNMAELALLHLTELLSLNSKYQDSALKLKQEILNKKAEKELKIALFFKNLGWYQASLNRVKDILKDYPKTPLKPKVLLTGFQLSKTLNQDSSFFKQELLKLYPKSKEAKALTKPSLFYRIKEKVL